MDVPAASCTEGLIARLKGLLALHPGPLPVVVRVVGGEEVTRVRLGDEFRVDGSPALVLELRALLGEEAVRLAAASVGAGARPAMVPGRG